MDEQQESSQQPTPAPVQPPANPAKLADQQPAVPAVTEPAAQQDQQPFCRHDPPQPTEDKLTKNDKIMIWLTVFIALGTIVSAIAIAFQWHEMHVGGKDTTRIAEAAEKQRDAAQQFANTADKINGNINGAVGKLEEQAKKMDEARRSAQRSAAESLDATIRTTRISQRAYLIVPLAKPTRIRCPDQVGIDLPSPTVPNCYHVQFKNIGSSPASAITVKCFAHFGPKLPPPLPLEEACDSDDDNLASGSNTFLEARTKPTYAMASEGLEIMGTITYSDVFGDTHQVGFCTFVTNYGMPTSCGSSLRNEKRSNEQRSKTK